MSNLVDGILDQLGPAGVAQIARSIGVDEQVMGPAVAAAIPAILGGMAANSRREQGAESLSDALDDHSPTIFDGLGSLLGGDAANEGVKILGHVFGNSRHDVERNLAGRSGVDLDVIIELLPILAPLVMGYLSREKQSRGLDAGGLGSVLQRERQVAERRSPGLGGLAALLDADGDGSVIDDVLGRITGR